MKTEQEQRQAIRQILFDANDICNATPCEDEYCKYHGEYRCQDNVTADKLIEACYGDVSEYKAEIERLKSENKQRVNDTDKLKAEIDRLNTIVERLDELIGKGIDEYINGIDGVKGAREIWERSAVRAFAEKLKKRLKLGLCEWQYAQVDVRTIDDLLKEYENDKCNC